MQFGLKKNGATAEVIASHLGGPVRGRESGQDVRRGRLRHVRRGLLGEDEVKHFVREAYNHGKAIAVTGEGSELLQATGIPSARRAWSMGRRGRTTASFIEAIGRRHWNRPK